MLFFVAVAVTGRALRLHCPRRQGCFCVGFCLGNALAGSAAGAAARHRPHPFGCFGYVNLVLHGSVSDEWYHRRQHYCLTPPCNKIPEIFSGGGCCRRLTDAQERVNRRFSSRAQRGVGRLHPSLWRRARNRSCAERETRASGNRYFRPARHVPPGFGSPTKLSVEN